jgi:ABC-type dipeptide/oligopeptide/nickel transport system permease component
MRDYFIRRFLLLIPTLMVITVIVFCVTRIAPGGPLERAMMEMRQAQMEGGGGGGATATGKAISKKDLEQMQELYGYDKPGWQAYLIWLGVMSRERHKEEFVFKDDSLTVTGKKRIPTFPVMELDWNGDGFVSHNEVPRSMRNEVRFESLDTNRDGYLDEVEGTRPGSQVRRTREAIELERDAQGVVKIKNRAGLFIDWRVRMKNPMTDLAGELEDAVDKLKLTVSKDATVIPLQRAVEGFLERAEKGRALSWPDAYKQAQGMADELAKFQKGTLASVEQALTDNNATQAKGQLEQATLALVNAAEAGRAPPTAEVYLKLYSGVFQGDLGTSFKSNEPVWEMIKNRLPVSSFFGLMTFMITYIVCIPLGIAKAMRHNGPFDNISSIAIFMGYSIPGYVLGALLVVFLAARAGLFPTGGFVSENFHGMPVEKLTVEAGTEKWSSPAHGLANGASVWFQREAPPANPPLLTDTGYFVKRIDENQFTLHADPALADAPIDITRSGPALLRRPTTLVEQAKDLLHHVFLPLCCYLVTSFAFVTMLMKNHLMDNLSADYMRTAIAKGVPFGQAVRRHALRNSLIPIATNLGHQVILFVAGSFLIETIFDINGFGLMGFTAIDNRDIPVVMGVFLLSATLILFGNILSDILVALVDPRVQFE